MLATLAISFALTVYTRPVTALAMYDGAVYVGGADGVVERIGSDFAIQQTYRKIIGSPVSFVAASPYGVAWLDGPGGTIRERVAASKPAEQTLTISSGGRTFSILFQPVAPVRRLSWIAGRIAVSYDLGTTFFDSKAHAIAPSSFMPADAATLASNSSLWVREQDDGTELAVFARPYSVRRNPDAKAPLVSLFTAFQVGAWQWAKLGGFASNAFDAFPDGELKVTEEGRLASDTKFLVLSDRVGLAQDGIVAREPQSLASVPIYAQDWEIGRIDAATIPGDSLWFGAGGDNAWWWNGSALVQQSRSTGRYSAYLPWSDEGMKPTCFAADKAGIWIGSNHGVRYLDPAHADEKLGYAGFLRTAYGVEATSSADPNAKKLTDAVFAWRFADAEKAGADGGIMVSSIFSVLGLKLPQTAPELIKAGAPVSDELRFGDVLLTSKASAVYLGNGITVEVRAGRVQNGEIWAFPKASVRRFSP